MPTYRNNLHLGTKDPLVDTDSIADGAITTPKIADGAVTEPKLSDDVRELLHFRELRFLRTWKTALPATAEEGEYALAPSGNVVYFKEGRWLGEPFSKIILYIDCVNHRFYRWDGSKLVEISTTIQFKTINGHSIVGSGNIVISTEGQIVIDDEIDYYSTNAISNRAVGNALAGLEQSLGERIDDYDAYFKSTVRLIPLTGILPSSTAYTPESSGNIYSGNGGDLFLDLSNNRVVLVVSEGGTTKYYVNWQSNQYRPDDTACNQGNRLYAFVDQDGVHIGFNNEGTWVEMKDNASPELDTELDSRSTNAVQNKAIKKALDETNEAVNEVGYRMSELESLYHTTRLLPYDGPMTQVMVVPEQTGYAGSGGEILFDGNNGHPRMLLKVSNKYYDTWNDNGHAPSSAYNDQLIDFATGELRDDIMLWRVISDVLHIYRYSNGMLREVASSSNVTVDSALNSSSNNPVRNSAIATAISGIQDDVTTLQGDVNALTASQLKIHVIRVWGDDYQDSEVWNVGELWYDEAMGELKVCTDNTHTTPVFEDVWFDENALYRLADTARWYVWSNHVSTLVEITNESLLELVSEYHTLLNQDLGRAKRELATLTQTVINLQRDYVTLQGDVAALEAEIHGTPVPYSSSPDPEPAVIPFDPVECNQGYISIAKDPENILTSDVTGALTIDALEETSNLWLASQYLSEGTSASIMSNNAAALRTLASAESACPGLKIDGEFYINTNAGNIPANAIVLEKDFTIDGKDGISEGVNGKLVSTNGCLFSTTHSLDVRDTRFQKNYAYQSNLFYIDTTPGIEQLQVTGCEFNDTQYVGYYIVLYADKTLNPLDILTGAPIETNCIHHINIDGNTVTAGGNNLVYSVGVRVTDSWRITNNTISGITGHAVSFEYTDNGTSSIYAGLMQYMSCPLYIAGNSFTGKQGINRYPVTSTIYAAAAVEVNTLYFIRNTVTDFVSGESFLKAASASDSTQGTQGRCPTYDIYANVTRLYQCNNTVVNLVRFTKDRNNFGTFKQKGACIPGEYADAHSTRSMKPVRCIKNNTYSSTGDDLTRLMGWWANRTYVDKDYYSASKKHDKASEQAYDATLESTLYLYTSINLALGTVADQFIPKVEVTGNTFNYPMIGGGSMGTCIHCDHFIASGNTFNSEHIVCAAYSTRGIANNQMSDSLFSVRALQIDIKSNTFTAQNHNIRLLQNKAYIGNGDLGPATTDITGNSVGSGSQLSVIDKRVEDYNASIPVRTKYEIEE